MPVTQEYDVVVIGAGPTGENVADRAVKKGLTAAIAESELVGGECSYWACMPSKALLRPVAAVDDARHVEGVGGAALEPAGVLDRRGGGCPPRDEGRPGQVAGRRAHRAAPGSGPPDRAEDRIGERDRAAGPARGGHRHRYRGDD